MTHNKILKAFKIATCFKGSATKQHILKNLDADSEVLATLTAKQLAAVLNVADRSYHDGKASCKAEIADDCIWIGGQVQKLIPLKALEKLEINRVDSYAETGFSRWSAEVTYSLNYVEKL